MMNDKICLITGGTSGIGKETAIALAEKGAHIVLTARNMAKGELVKKEITEKTGSETVDVMECDLSSLKDVKKFTDTFLIKYKKLDILINNAGIWETKRKESADGIELTFAVNHLAPFLITNELLGILKQSKDARIINVASDAHRYGTINFKDIEMKKSFSHMKAYSQSKLANILFTKELARRLEGDSVTVNCLHPGVVATQLFDNMGSIVKSVFSFFMISPKKGAETTIFLASSPDVTNISGEYFKKKKPVRSSSESYDQNISEKLWKLSEDYISKNS